MRTLQTYPESQELYGDVQVSHSELLLAREDTVRSGPAKDIATAEVSTGLAQKQFPLVQQEPFDLAVVQALEDEAEMRKRVAREKEEVQKRQLAEAAAQAELAQRLERE